MDDFLNSLDKERLILYGTAFIMFVAGYLLVEIAIELLGRAGYLRAIDGLPETEEIIEHKSTPESEPTSE